MDRVFNPQPGGEYCHGVAGRVRHAVIVIRVAPLARARFERVDDVLVHRSKEGPGAELFGPRGELFELIHRLPDKADGEPGLFGAHRFSDRRMSCSMKGLAGTAAASSSGVSSGGFFSSPR